MSIFYRCFIFPMNMLRLGYLSRSHVLNYVAFSSSSQSPKVLFSVSCKLQGQQLFIYTYPVQDERIMIIDEYRKIPIVEKWLLRIDAKPTTIDNYLHSIRLYCDFLNKTPDELIEEAEAEIKAGKLMRERKIETYLLSFKRDLQNQGLALMTIKNRMTGVKSFYKSNYIELPFLPKTKYKPLEKNKDIPTKEDVQEVLKVCDPVEKAVILVGVSSGLSANEIRNIKVKHFTKGFDPVTKITTLKLRREKVRFDFITLLSPEASMAVQDYLNFRNREPHIHNTHLIEHLRKQKVYSENDYLFIGRKIPPEFLETMNDELRKFERDSFVSFYTFISAKAQKSTTKGDWNLIRAHNMRKYFNSVMLNAGCDSFL
jgi:integrase